LDLNSRGTPQTWYYNALGNFKLGKADVAAASATKSLAMDPLHTAPNTGNSPATFLPERGPPAAAAFAHSDLCAGRANADVIDNKSPTETVVPVPK
jgi:hypothetical protein